MNILKILPEAVSGTSFGLETLLVMLRESDRSFRIRHPPVNGDHLRRYDAPGRLHPDLVSKS
jgi:hypothetical protein